MKTRKPKIVRVLNFNTWEEFWTWLDDFKRRRMIEAFESGKILLLDDFEVSESVSLFNSDGKIKVSLTKDDVELLERKFDQRLMEMSDEDFWSMITGDEADE